MTAPSLYLRHQAPIGAIAKGTNIPGRCPTVQSRNATYIAHCSFHFLVSRLSAAFGRVPVSSAQLQIHFVLGVVTFPQCPLAYFQIQDLTYPPALAAYISCLLPQTAQGTRKGYSRSQILQARRKPQENISDSSQVPE